MASRGCSPSSILPPGNSHLSGIGWCRVLWQARMRSSFRISAATTLFILLATSLLGNGVIFFQAFTDQLRAILNQFAVFRAECCRKVAVNIQLARYFTA